MCKKKGVKLISKNIKKNFFGTITFVMLTAIVFGVVQVYLDYVDPVNTASVTGFKKEQENSLDVVVLGASEVYAGYCPVIAWEEFGYTSYSFANAGMPGSLYKSMIREVLNKQTPKVLVIEVNGFLQQDWYYDRSLNLKGWIDSIEDPKQQELAVKEATDGENFDLYNMSSLELNHNNWKMPAKCAGSFYAKAISLFQRESYLKGYSTKAYNIKENDKDEEEEKKLYFTRKSKKYFEELLTFCNDQGIENVLFVRFPHMKKISNSRAFDEIRKMVEEHGYTFINFETQRGQMDILSGEYFYNSEHLNIFGTQKMTKSLGKYLVNHYDLSTNHSDEIKKQWNKSLKDFKKFRKLVEKKTKEKNGTLYFEYRRL